MAAAAVGSPGDTHAAMVGGLAGLIGGALGGYFNGAPGAVIGAGVGYVAAAILDPILL